MTNKKGQPLYEECPVVECKRTQLIESKLWNIQILVITTLLGVVGILLRIQFFAKG